MILEKFDKQPADVQDYDVDYTEWLAALADTAPGPSGLVVYADDGIAVVTSILVDGVAKVWVSGGISGTTYKVTTTLSTTGGRVKQAEISIKVKES